MIAPIASTWTLSLESKRKRKFLTPQVKILQSLRNQKAFQTVPLVLFAEKNLLGEKTKQQSTDVTSSIAKSHDIWSLNEAANIAVSGSQSARAAYMK